MLKGTETRLLGDDKTPPELTAMLARGTLDMGEALVSAAGSLANPLVLLFVLVGASIGVLLLSAPLTYFVTGGKYELPLVLVVAACVNGAAKVIAGVQNAVVTACGTESDVASLKWLTWVMITGGVIGAWAGSVYGLAGLVTGAGIGSLIGALPCMYLAYQVLRREQMPEGQASPMDAANLPVG